MQRWGRQRRGPRGMPAPNRLVARRTCCLRTTKRWRKLRTTVVRDHDDIRAFFDACAEHYAETHGDTSSLLRYRLALIHTTARFRPTDVVLEIGCGNGLHLLS